MRLLESQQEFEFLIGRGDAASPDTFKTPEGTVVVYFTASWCGACQRLNLDELQEATATAAPGTTWMKCDVDRNNYTLGYCGLRSIPSFVVIRGQKIIGQLSNSKTERVKAWLQVLLEDVKE